MVSLSDENMDCLKKISSTFDNLRNSIKIKCSSERIANLKRDILSLSTDLVQLGKENHDSYIRSLAMEGYLSLLAAKTFPISQLEKKNLLQAAFNKLKQFAIREECLFIVLRLQNLLCYCLLQLEQLEMARDILESIEELYDAARRAPSRKFLDAEDLFTAEPVAQLKPVSLSKLDKVITNNIQMQAFLYNKLRLPDKYALYNHMALRRQLELKEGTPQEWAMRTARLGNFFTYLNQIMNAHQHLSAAYHVLRTCYDNAKLMPDEYAQQKTDFEVYFLELSHYWVKYGLALFKLSKKKILDQYFSNKSEKIDLWQTVNVVGDRLGETFRAEDGVSPEAKKNEDSEEVVFSFPTLNLKVAEAPLGLITDVEQARRTFNFTHKWLMRSKHFYDFEHQPAQYISCTLQLAELYEHLAFFEKDIDHQYSLQRRRADVLESLNSLLKTRDHVMSVQIDVIRELSQVQLELMALNLQKLWREESHTEVNAEFDVDSIISSMDNDSLKMGPTRSHISRNTFLRKMEATLAMSSKLGRLSGQLGITSPSQFSMTSTQAKTESCVQ